MRGCVSASHTQHTARSIPGGMALSLKSLASQLREMLLHIIRAGIIGIYLQYALKLLAGQGGLADLFIGQP